jgi:hypothetical protein
VNLLPVFISANEDPAGCPNFEFEDDDVNFIPATD